jgi:hypothetical protein
MPSRRDLLASVAALPVLGQAQSTAAPEYKPRLFSPTELDLIRDLADTIIPRTDTPGAADAKAAAFRRGLAAAAASVKSGKSTTALLTELTAAKSPFFKQLKDLTIDGYYSSKEGLATELGWHGQVAVSEFKGCTHKEHQG